MTYMCPVSLLVLYSKSTIEIFTNIFDRSELDKHVL